MDACDNSNAEVARYLREGLGFVVAGTLHPGSSLPSSHPSPLPIGMMAKSHFLLLKVL